MNTTGTAPIVVGYQEVARVLLRSEAAMRTAAPQDGVEAAAAMAAMGAILNHLREAQDAHGVDGVLVTANHGPTARLQNLIASGALGSLDLRPLEHGGLEAKFDTGDWGGWATVAWAKLKNPVKHPLLRPGSTTPAALPDHCRVGVIGDWATGLYGAPVIAKTVQADPSPLHALIHLGDVYYAGTHDEVQRRFLDIWPKRPDAIHRAVNSNHEMYAGGYGYFELTLPAFRQDASYFALQNAHWTLLGLDLAYDDHSIDDGQVEWIEKVIANAGNRRIVFLSHHQLFSAFESQARSLWANARFRRILDGHRIFAWYWGHEHGCYLYESREARSGVWGRCIGHGGMPESRKKSRSLPSVPQQARADWRRVAPRVLAGGDVLPAALVLEGSNPYFGKEADKFTPHGFAVLTFDGPTLLEEIFDPAGQVVLSNRLA